jgi:hypothetical protein
MLNGSVKNKKTFQEEGREHFSYRICDIRARQSQLISPDPGHKAQGGNTVNKLATCSIDS